MIQKTVYLKGEIVAELAINPYTYDSSSCVWVNIELSNYFTLPWLCLDLRHTWQSSVIGLDYFSNWIIQTTSLSPNSYWIPRAVSTIFRFANEAFELEDSFISCLVSQQLWRQSIVVRRGELCETKTETRTEGGPPPVPVHIVIRNVITQETMVSKAQRNFRSVSYCSLQVALLYKVRSRNISWFWEQWLINWTEKHCYDLLKLFLVGILSSCL